MRSNRRLRLRFASDVVYAVGYIDADAEKVADALLRDVSVQKSNVPCG